MRKGIMELDILDYYKKLVDFLGAVLGKNAEVVLRDCRKPDHDIIAIANGHVSGRTIGAPITDFTLSILANEEWKERDYVVNYEGKAAPDKRLRSSTYFIREEGKLVGQLCVNIDMTPYEQVMDSIRQLSGMELMSDGGKSGICNFYFFLISFCYYKVFKSIILYSFTTIISYIKLPNHLFKMFSFLLYFFF